MKDDITLLQQSFLSIRWSILWDPNYIQALAKITIEWASQYFVLCLTLQNISVFKSSVQVEVGYLNNYKYKYKIVHQQNKSITSLHFLQIFMYCASKIIAGIVVDRKLVKESRKQIYHSEMM